ncbi:MAG TPA: heavy metal-binding domain-containing protein [Bryobacteraceae bacterium]|nr:heavy metal-binding domain-containing protein [Bryobacteraceae bacterium]
MRIFLAALLALALNAQGQSVDAKQPASPIAPIAPQDYVCPMDKDVRSDKPGYCPRCGMKLVLGIPEDVEYPLELNIQPRVFRAGEKVQLKFRVADPHNGKTVDHFEIVHEKLFHMFLVSDDLEYFVHDHPVPQPDGTFLYDETFPKPGLYRVAGDFYPTGGTPQLVANTVIVPGAPGSEVQLANPVLKPELGVSHCTNMDVSLVMDPPQPIAGMKTLLFFHVNPGDGLEKYIGAWGHMLVASDDLIDLIHDHPFIADGGPQLQFNIIFPRARTYRIWVQFQRNGVVNTASFTVPVSELK